MIPETQSTMMPTTTPPRRLHAKNVAHQHLWSTIPQSGCRRIATTKTTTRTISGSGAWPRSVWLRLLLVVSLAISTTLPGCHGMPTLLLDSHKAQCINLEAPQDTVIRIKYSSPDMIIDKHDPEYSMTHLTVNVMPAHRVLDTKLHMSPIKSRLNPTNQLLETREGFVLHKYEVDGEAAICVRNAGASAKNPVLLSLRVEKTQDDPMFKTVESGTALDEHLSHMELEVKRIEMGMKAILSEAEFSKERDALFHKQTVGMHSATMFWPIVQVCVLIMTGFTQASHIVRFFQSRRII